MATTTDDAPSLTDLPPLSAQADRLIELEVPQLAGIDEKALRQAVEQWGADRNDALLALSPQLAPASALTALLGWGGRNGAGQDGDNGAATLDMVDVDEAGPAEVDMPAGDIYLVRDPDHGDDLKNLTPEEALTDIVARDRSPMLLTEALYWVLQQPEILEQGHSSMTLGSLLRRPGGFYNQRVPALWGGHDPSDESQTSEPPHRGDTLAPPAGQPAGGDAEGPAAGALSWRWWGSRHSSLGAATIAARLPVPSA